MGSSRFPGKVLRRLGSQSLLGHVVARARQAVPRVAVLTSDRPGDDPVARYCERHAIDCWRGPEDDVLERFRRAAQELGADSVIRLTADNPLIDPAIVTACVKWHASPSLDLSSTRVLQGQNIVRRTAPIGMSVDVIRAAALHEGARMATTSFQREHVIPVFFGGDTFRVSLVELGLAPEALGANFSIDTEADLARMERLVAVAGEDADLPRLLRAQEAG